MEDLRKLLEKKGAPKKSPTITLLEEWCAKEYPAQKVGVQQRTRDILLRVPSAALAQELHMRALEMKSAAKLDKDARLTIRIS